jgi:hypothetical protein
MKIKKLAPILWLSIAAIMFASCSSSNQFASSFGKRKYMKGYYVDPKNTGDEVVASQTAATLKETSNITVSPKASAIGINEKPASSKIDDKKVAVIPASKSGLRYQPVVANQASSEDKSTDQVANVNSLSNEVLASTNNANSIQNTTYRSSSSGGGFFDIKDHPIRFILTILFVVLIVVLIIVLVAAGAPVTVTNGP